MRLKNLIMSNTKQPIHVGNEQKTSGRFRKSKPRAANATKGDEAKFLSYAEAWARIRAARKHGFFLEAVTSQESIISDRLTSFVVKNCGEDSSSNSLRTLHNLTGAWIKLSCGHLPTAAACRNEMDELHLRLNQWREERNDVVHGLVKSRASKGDDHIQDFLTRAATAALEGEVLARQISRWVDNARREMKSAIRTSQLNPSTPETSA